MVTKVKAHLRKKSDGQLINVRSYLRKNRSHAFPIKKHLNDTYSPIILTDSSASILIGDLQRSNPNKFNNSFEAWKTIRNIKFI